MNHYLHGFRVKASTFLNKFWLTHFYLVRHDYDYDYILQHFPKKHGTGPEEDGTDHGTALGKRGRVGREQVSKHSIIWIATIS